MKYGGVPAFQNFPNMQNFNSYDYGQSYMLKHPYEMIYHQQFMENFKNQGVENQPYYYRMMNSKQIKFNFLEDLFKYFSHMPEFMYRGQAPSQYGTYPGSLFNFDDNKPKNESIFNLINDKENLNRINKIANEGVNHIVAAFYIKSVQQTRMNAARQQETNTNIRPISLVDQEIQNAITGNSANSNLSNNESSSPKNKQLGNFNMFNDKCSPDVNEFTASQLNSVNDIMKKLKENKMSEIIEKDYSRKEINK